MNQNTKVKEKERKATGAAKRELKHSSDAGTSASQLLGTGVAI